MTPYYDSPEGQIYLGHTLTVLPQLKPKSVHMIVTSPPYWGLRDYSLDAQVWDDGGRCDHVWGDTGPEHHPGQVQDGKAVTDENAKGQTAGSGQFCQKCNAWRGSLGLEPTPELFVQHIVQIFHELKRVLRDDGTLWLNLGDSYASNWGMGAKRKSSWWSTRSEELEGKGSVETAIPPNSFDGKDGRLKVKDLVGIPWMVAFALRADGWYLRSDIIWHKPNPMPESVTDRPTKCHEYMFLLTKSQRYFYDAEAIKENIQDATKVRYQSGWNGDEQRGYIDGKPQNHMSNYMGSDAAKEATGRNKRTVWTIPTHPMPEAHFATFPPKLIEPCILAGTSEKGCCPECGAPWERVVEKEFIPQPDIKDPKKLLRDADALDATSSWGGSKRGSNSTKTTGWKPTCSCYDTEPFPEYPKQEKEEEELAYEIRIEPIRIERLRLLELWKPLKAIPCTTMDPFFGSGTVGIVSYKHGRKFKAIDLSKTYLDDIAIPRIERETSQQRLPGGF